MARSQTLTGLGLLLKNSISNIYRQRLQLAGLFLGALLPLLVFGTLAGSVRAENQQTATQGLWGDVWLLELLHRCANPSLDETISRLTIVGGALALPGILTLAAFLQATLKKPRVAAFFLACTSGAWALDVLTKLIFHRPRPALWPSPLPEKDFSFPSGHAMVSMAIFTSLMAVMWPTKLRWFMICGGTLGVLIIALSRLYLGVHYPSDILAGWCAAVIWVFGLGSLVLREPAIQNEI